MQGSDRDSRRFLTSRFESCGRVRSLIEVSLRSALAAATTYFSAPVRTRRASCATPGSSREVAEPSPPRRGRCGSYRQFYLAHPRIWELRLPNWPGPRASRNSLASYFHRLTCPRIRGPATNEAVEKTAGQSKFTIWTAPASFHVPVLAKLDMGAPLGGVRSARKRAARTTARVKTRLAFFVSRPVVESLRKPVK
jgi:hypothetical protein